MVDSGIALSFRAPAIADPLAEVGKVVTLRHLLAQGPLQAEQLRTAQLENQQRQIQMDQQKALGEAISGAVTVGADGVPTTDHPRVIQRLGTTAPSLIPGYTKGMLEGQELREKLVKAKQENEIAERNHIGSLAYMVHQSGDDPAVFMGAFGQLQSLYDKTLGPAIKAALADPSKIPAFNKHLMDQAPEQRKIASEEVSSGARATQAGVAKDLAPSRKKEADATAANREAELPKIQAEAKLATFKADRAANTKPEDLEKLVDEIVPPGQPLNLRTKALVRDAMKEKDVEGARAAIRKAEEHVAGTEQAVATAKNTAGTKIMVAAATPQAVANAAGVTEDDYRRAGQQYAMTGVMPPLGRGSFDRSRIMHFANEFARENHLSPKDIVTAQAAFQGDVQSLKKFQAQRDQIVSFENTAKKNLDLFIGLADKIPDTGVPWANTPVRLIDTKLLGSDHEAAVNAARQVANNEIAKVTSGGGLSGVLSDSARHEVMEYNPKDATFKQTLAVAKVLSQDMANRHQSMDAMLGEIKGRMSGGGGGTGQPTGSEAGTPKVENWKRVNGKLVKE